MSSIVLSHKAQKLMKLCEIEGFESVEDVLFSSIADSVCPAICMTEGCDYTAEMEPDQDRGFCEVCGGNTVVSALILAGLI
jgi:hypothetical protein